MIKLYSSPVDRVDDRISMTWAKSGMSRTLDTLSFKELKKSIPSLPESCAVTIVDYILKALEKEREVVYFSSISGLIFY
jgi:hypothetical protein